MKNLEKNRNIYIKHNRFYIDYQKDGVRIRRATGLKKSPLAFDFIRKNYNLFLGSEEDIELAKSWSLLKILVSLALRGLFIDCLMKNPF